MVEDGDEPGEADRMTAARMATNGLVFMGRVCHGTDRKTRRLDSQERVLLTVE